MQKGLLWRRWGETWWKLGMGDVEKRKDDTFLLSPLFSNPLWFVDCSVLRDFHWLFFLVVTLKLCQSNLHIDLCPRLLRMTGQDEPHTSTGNLHTAASAELCRSHMVQGWGPGWCTLYDAQRLMSSLPAHRHTSYLCPIFHFISSVSLHITSFLSCIFNITVSPLAFPLTLILLNHLLTFKRNKSTNQLTHRASKQRTNQLTNSQSYWSWDTLLPSKLNFSENSY